MTDLKRAIHVEKLGLPVEAPRSQRQIIFARLVRERCPSVIQRESVIAIIHPGVVGGSLKKLRGAFPRHCAACSQLFARVGVAAT